MFLCLESKRHQEKLSCPRVQDIKPSDTLHPHPLNMVHSKMMGHRKIRNVAWQAPSTMPFEQMVRQKRQGSERNSLSGLQLKDDRAEVSEGIHTVANGL